MGREQHVVLGLAHPRSTWFGDVGRWSTTGSLAATFIKCVSIEDLRARLATGRAFSAALLDARLPVVDRDLLATLADLDIAAIVVRSGAEATDWLDLGASTALDDPLDRVALVDALAAHGRLIDVASSTTQDPSLATVTQLWRGRLIGVAGQHGAGTSTIAAALAQGLATDPRAAGDVVLADLAHRAHQAMLHDARDVVPALQELIEAHRSGRPSPAEVRRLTFAVPTRGYHLLLGLRRPSDWITVRSRAFDAALDNLRGSARIVVADLDSDLDGEAETGSLDIEDRNHMARHVSARADLILSVATPTLTGIHGLVTHISALRDQGVPGERILAVINRAPRSPRSRADISRAVADLTGSASLPDPHLGPVYVPARRHVDAMHRDVLRFPPALSTPITTAVHEMLERLPANTAEPEPEPIRPGSLGITDEEATS